VRLRIGSDPSSSGATRAPGAIDELPSRYPDKRRGELATLCEDDLDLAGRREPAWLRRAVRKDGGSLSRPS
jgi:hypothetical protein